MSPGSYDPNLGSEILILGGDKGSRVWLNIGDSYGTIQCMGQDTVIHLVENRPINHFVSKSISKDSLYPLKVI